MKKMQKILVILLMFLGFMPNIYANSFAEYNKEVNTDALLLVNPSNNEILYEKNANKKLTMASTTKIMTYAIVSEYISDLNNTMIEIKQSSIDKIDIFDASTAGFEYHVGESFKAIDILRGMMIPSGCEAAQILADYIEETYSVDFVEKMNEKALDLGMTSTYYVDPHGLDNSNQTTALDMYKLAKYVNDLPYFSEITNTSSYLIPGFSYEIKNTNYLINNKTSGSARKYYYKYAIGTKTGSTPTAGKCLVSRAKKGSDEFIVIALNGSSINGNNSAMIDTINLYDYAFMNYTQSINISVPKYQSVNLNGTIKISYKVESNNTKEKEKLTWTSLNPDIATVDQNGIVKGKSLGTAKIKVETQTGDFNIINVSVGFFNTLNIDNSYYDYTSGEAKELDWDYLKKDGFDFIIIRNDDKFINNIKGAIDNNLKFTLSYLATAKNEQDAINEANELISLINKFPNYKSYLTMPLVYDMYSLSSSRDSYASMNKNQTTNIALAFANRLKEEGYNTIIYNGRTAFNNMNTDILRENNIGIYAIYRYEIADKEEYLKTKLQTVSGLDVDMWEYTYDEYLKEAISYDATYLSLMYMGNIYIYTGLNGSAKITIHDKIVSIDINPTDGYELDNINVSSKLYDYKLTKEKEGRYSFILKNDYTDIRIILNFKPSNYKFIKENNVKNSNKDLIFKINGNMNLVDKVYINNYLLPTKYYKTKDNKLIISKNYIEKLKDGQYKIKLLLSNNEVILGKFTKHIINESQKEINKNYINILHTSNAGNIKDFNKEVQINNKKTKNIIKKDSADKTKTKNIKLFIFCGILSIFLIILTIGTFKNYRKD